MKKIIAVFDGLYFSEATLVHAIYLAKQMNAHLEGLFLDDKLYNSYDIYEVVQQKGTWTNDILSLQVEDDQTREESVRTFEQACKKEAINFSIHRNSNPALQELIHESIYADLLIIDQKECFKYRREEKPTTFIRNLLTDVECPVFLVTSNTPLIEKIVLLYDGEPSAVYAIKMFSYLGPIDTTMETEVVSVKNAPEFLHYENTRLMSEFMERHFPAAQFKVLPGEPEQTILEHLAEQKPNTLVIMGAYRRSNVSRWFRASMADVVMDKLNLPLFVAHK
ncbi:hypothetical protein COR50_11515 [Chitinophaga caeni]|uniref:UspA domain-containing protein n=1 Tax=Chitinophaga caeni TaxID=2029983 RepID=A0A291QUW2_9BACT|nr:universal stress protein [Chitinophaga caeni]ATL47740.1 hypothetical protein COR50_11515 [Chitinophaga caeni]